MKEDAKLDKWLREGVDNYRAVASESAKSRFMAGAAELTGTSGNTASAGFFNRRFYTLLAIALLLVGSGLVLWYTGVIPSDGSEEYPAVKAVQGPDRINGKELKNESSKLPVRDLPAKEKLMDIPEKESLVALQAKNVETGIPAMESLTDLPEKESLIDLPDKESLIDLPEKENLDDISDKEDLTDVPVNETLNDIADKEPVTEVPVETAPAEPVGIMPAEGADKPEPHSQRVFGQSLSLYYRPEIIWNVIGNEKGVQSFGIDWNRRLFSGNYLAGTGVGLSLTRGYYEYAIEMNEYLGVYNKLDSISFNWNAREFNMEQTLHTSQEEVFDTAITTDHARIDRKFVYLQVPVTLGYDLVNRPNTTFGLRFAPVLSVLLSKKPVDFRYEPGKNKIVQINRITPDRVKTNWQLTGGLCYGRRLGESLWLEIEPGVAYYFNSVYEKSENSSSPLGASIRVALGIKY